MSKPIDPPPKPSDDVMGKCALCGTEIIRYGPAGKPLCGECEAASGKSRNSAPLRR